MIAGADNHTQVGIACRCEVAKDGRVVGLHDCLIRLERLSSGSIGGCSIVSS